MIKEYITADLLALFAIGFIITHFQNFNIYNPIIINTKSDWLNFKGWDK